MLQKLRNLALAFSGVVLVGLAPALMGPSGGFPSRPNFQAVGVGTTAPTQSGQITTSASLNNGLRNTEINTSNGTAAFSAWTLQNDAGVSHICQFGQTSSTSTATIFTGGPTTEQGFIGCNSNIPLSFGVNGAEVLRLTSTDAGTFTANYDDACTTTPSQVIDYQKTGNQVTLSFRAAPAACTGDSVNFATTGTPVPAAIRPTGTSSGAIHSALCNNFLDNSVGASAWAQVSETGNISFVRATVSGANLISNTWTAALNRQSTRDCQVTYMLGNP